MLRARRTPVFSVELAPDDLKKVQERFQRDVAAAFDPAIARNVGTGGFVGAASLAFNPADSAESAVRLFASQAALRRQPKKEELPQAAAEREDADFARAHDDAAKFAADLTAAGVEFKTKFDSRFNLLLCESGHVNSRIEDAKAAVEKRVELFRNNAAVVLGCAILLVSRLRVEKRVKWQRDTQTWDVPDRTLHSNLTTSIEYVIEYQNEELGIGAANLVLLCLRSLASKDSGAIDDAPPPPAREAPAISAEEALCAYYVQVAKLLCISPDGAAAGSAGATAPPAVAAGAAAGAASGAAAGARTAVAAGTAHLGRRAAVLDTQRRRERSGGVSSDSGSSFSGSGSSSGSESFSGSGSSSGSGSVSGSVSSSGSQRDGDGGSGDGGSGDGDGGEDHGDGGGDGGGGDGGDGGGSDGEDHGVEFDTL
jgi:hypothetical protein